ncbi:MAG: NAD(P)-binding domain-containing protein [Phycisphaerales bacterium]
MHHTKVALIGAGPIGIEMAVSLRRAGVDYVHFEAGQIGSTIAWWAPQTRFFSSPERIAIAGVPFSTPTQDKGTREDYLNYLRNVVEQFDLPIRTGHRVEEAKRLHDGSFELCVSHRGQPTTWHADKIILAIGDMHEPKMLGIPGENLPHVSHYFEDPHTYFRQRVLIVGGRNSAVEAAIRCQRVGAEVAMSYRGGVFTKKIKYWLRPELLALIDSGHIAFHKRTIVTEITPTEAVLAPVNELCEPKGDPFRIPADRVVLMTGYRQDPTLFRQLGVTLDGERLVPRVDEETMQSDVEGVYVCGTAVAGTQASGVEVFIETSHVHTRRIVRHITGDKSADADLETPVYALPES